MSAEIRGILKSVGVELLGSSLDKVTRIHFQPHGPDLDDTGTPSPTTTGPELATQLSFSQNPTRIFLSATDLQTFWDVEGAFNWDSWYKLALYYNDAQSVERVYVPDGFISVFDDGTVVAGVDQIFLTDGMEGTAGPVGPDGVTGSVNSGTGGWLEMWGNQYIAIKPSVPGGFGALPRLDIATRGDPTISIITGVLYSTVIDGDGTMYVSATELLSILGEAAGGPFDPDGQYCFIIVPENGTGTPITNPNVGFGPILGQGVSAHTMPVIREIGVVGQPAITQWDQQAFVADTGFLEGVNLELTTALSFFDPDSTPDPISTSSIPFTIATPQDGYPSRIEFSFADLNAVNPNLFDTFWVGALVHLYVRVQNAGGQYDTYGITQFTPGGGEGG